MGIWESRQFLQGRGSEHVRGNILTVRERKGDWTEGDSEEGKGKMKGTSLTWAENTPFLS